MKKLSQNIVLFILFVSLISGYAVNGFSQEKGKKQLPDSLKIEKVDTTRVFLNDTVHKIKWETGGKAGLTLSQAFLSNWVAGGESSASFIGTMHLFANQKKKYASWNNSLDLQLGFTSQGKKFRKTTDRLEMTTEKRIYLKSLWFYDARLNFRSQLLPGYSSPEDTAIISNFMAPGYVFLTFGFDWHPGRGHTLLLAPLSGKFTIVADQALANKGAFGVIKATIDELTDIILTLGKNVKYEFGGYIRYYYKGNVTKTTSLESSLELFSNYLHKPQNIDVNWEVLGKVKISEVFSVNLYTHMIYDDDIKQKVDEDGNVLIGPKLQFMELLGLGVSVKF